VSIRKWCRPLFVVLALLWCTVVNAERTEQRIYSNVEYNEEGGDLLGTELELTIHEGGVDGHLKIYQGGCADPIQVTGTLSGNEVHVSGQRENYGKIELAGTVRDSSFSGSLRIEKAKTTQKIRLKRIATPHC
jgi:hypothetical protein